MAKLKSTLPAKKKRAKPKKPFIYRDARGRFITQKEYARLHKPVKRKPAIKKPVKISTTPKTKIQLKIKPTVTVVKKVKKKIAGKKKTIVSKKRRITKPPVVIQKPKKKRLVVISVRKKKKKAKKRKKRIAKPKGFELPVFKQLGMYNVEGIRGNSIAQTALMIADQIKRGAKRFRFWYKIKSSPAYPAGIASTNIVSWQLVSTKYKVGIEGYLKHLGGKVFFYWYVIA